MTAHFARAIHRDIILSVLSGKRSIKSEEESSKLRSRTDFPDAVENFLPVVQTFPEYL